MLSLPDSSAVCVFCRMLTEDVFPGGLQCAIAGPDCLFIVSNRGEILYWPREKLAAHFNILKRSSSRRMPVQVHHVLSSPHHNRISAPFRS